MEAELGTAVDPDNQTLLAGLLSSATSVELVDVDPFVFIRFRLDLSFTLDAGGVEGAFFILAARTRFVVAADRDDTGGSGVELAFVFEFRVSSGFIR